jgi:hypothetical protein
MAEVVYLLCTLASVACLVPLARSYLRLRTRLLLFSTLCFTGLVVNNVALFMDLVALPTLDLSMVRAVTAFFAVGALVFGLAWDSR